MADACVLVSGGIDSMTIAWEASHRYERVYPVYIKSGLYWEETEQKYINRFLEELDRDLESVKVLESRLDDIYPEHWSITGKEVPDFDSEDEEVYIPGRNILLLSKAGIFASDNDVGELLHGTLHGNPFPDSTREFFSTFEVMLSIGLDDEISIQTPYSGFDKEEVVSKAIENDLPVEYTFSCINPVGEEHCGACNKCRERQEAFENTGHRDPAEYAAGKP